MCLILNRGYHTPDRNWISGVKIESLDKGWSWEEGKVFGLRLESDSVAEFKGKRAIIWLEEEEEEEGEMEKKVDRSDR